MLIRRHVRRFIRKESGFTILQTVIATLIFAGITAGVAFALAGGLRGMTGYQLNVMQCTNPGFAQNNPTLCN